MNRSDMKQELVTVPEETFRLKMFREADAITAGGADITMSYYRREEESSGDDSEDSAVTGGDVPGDILLNRIRKIG